MIFENMLHMQLMMFSLVAIGFWVRKKGMMSTEGRKNLNELCLNITLPVNTFCAFLGKWDWNMLEGCSIALILSCIYCAVGVVLSHLFYKKEEIARKKTLRYGTMVSNGGFLGNPIIEGIYGSNGLLYASVFLLPVRMMMWSYGMTVFLNEKQKNRGLMKKIFTHPCVVAIYLGIIVMLSGINLPTFMTNTLTGLSKCNTPLSMMLIGMLLAEINPRGIWDKTMIFYTSVRLLIVPAICFIITAPFDIDPIIRGIMIIVAGLPSSVSTALLSEKHGGDASYATGMIFLTTILSLITLPVWCLYL